MDRIDIATFVPIHINISLLNLKTNSTIVVPRLSFFEKQLLIFLEDYHEFLVTSDHLTMSHIFVTNGFIQWDSVVNRSGLFANGEKLHWKIANGSIFLRTKLISGEQSKLNHNHNNEMDKRIESFRTKKRKILLTQGSIIDTYEQNEISMIIDGWGLQNDSQTKDSVPKGCNILVANTSTHPYEPNCLPMIQKSGIKRVRDDHLDWLAYQTTIKEICLERWKLLKFAISILNEIQVVELDDEENDRLRKARMDELLLIQWDLIKLIRRECGLIM